MKAIAILLNVFIILYLSLSFSQAPTFRRSYDLGQFDNAGNMVQTPDGGYAFGGINAIGFTFYGGLTKTDANGDIEWSNAYVSGFASVFTDIKNVSSGGYIATGESTSGGALLVRINANGTVAWANRYETPNNFSGKPANETGNAVIETSDGGFVVGGSVSYFWDGVSPSTVDTSSALGFKVDASGNVQWSRVWTVNVANPDEHFFNDVTETSDGYVFVGASSEGSGTLSDGDYPRNALIVKTDKVAGNTLFINRWGAGNSNSESITSAITLSNGNVLISGGDGDRAFLMRIQGNGSSFVQQYGRRINNATVFGIPQDTYILQSIDETSDGQYAFIGMRVAIFSFPNSFETIMGKINPSNNAIAFVRGYPSIGLSSILPKGGVTADDEFYTVMTDQQMTGFNYNMIKTDDQGLLNSTLTGCPNNDRNPSTSSYSPSIQTVPNSQFTGLNRTSYSPVVTAVSPTEVIHCLTTICTPPPLADNVTATPNPICAGQSTTINATGPGTDVSYNVYDAATGGTNLGTVPLAVSPGTTTSYFIETVDNNDPSCVSSSRVEIVVTVNPVPTVNPTSNSPICVGEDLNLSTNAVTGATYSWTGPNGFSSSAQNPTITGATAAADGTYSLTVTAAGCSTGPVTTDVIVSPTPTATAGAVSTTVCSGQDVELTANTVSGGTYSWTGPNGFTSSAQNPTISGVGVSADGVYSLQISVGSCTSNISTVDITVNPTPTVTIPAGDDEICVGETVTITPTTGGTWSSSNPSVATITNGGVVDGISAGTADMVFTDGTTGCSSIATQGQITVNAAPTVTIPAGDDEICVGETVTINPTTGGTWSSSDPSVATITNGGVVDGISAGTADMVFTDGTTGCSSTATSGEITVNPNPTVTIPAGDDEICVGETVTINPTTGGTWSSSDPSIATITNGGVVDGISAGTADMIFTDGTTGCSSTATQGQITVNAAPTVTIPAGDDEICVGETVTITPTTGGTWSSSDPSVATITNSGVVDGISAGTVNMIFTDGTTGCSSTATSGEITVNPNPTVTIPAGDDEICVGETVTITPTTGGTWSSSDPSVATITNGGVVDGISAGTADMVFTDGTTGCSSIATQGQITVNAAPTVTIPAGDDEICVGETVTITPTTGGTWSSSDPSVATITNGGVVDGLSSGTTEITFTDAITGCSNAVGSATITVYSLPTLTITGTDITCNGDGDGEATVIPTGNGPFNYNWSPSGGNNATASGLDAGSYSVVVTDDNGCEASETVTIDEPDELILTTSSTQSQCTVDDGTATVSASGGTGTYTYLWTPSGQTTATATGVGAGSYSVEVTDDNNCTANATVIVESLNGPSVSIIDQGNVSCIGANDGYAEAEASGGTPGYSYSWSPSGGNQATSTGLGSGTFTVEVTDDAGCTAIATVDITEPDALTIDETITDASCGQTDGAIAVTVSGGTPSYTYDWTPNVGNTSNIGNLSGGTYDLTVTDVNGCQITQTYNVGVSGALPINITPPSATIDAGESVDLNVVTAPGVSGESYTWTPAEGLSCSDCPNPNAAPDETTTYYVDVTTPDGCSAMDSIVIVVDQPCGDLFVPTIFSPNNDGNNDMLCVYGGCISSLEFQIYNRWGELIYTTNDNTECWDGTQNGDPVNTGVYVYKLNVTLSNGEEIQDSGNVNVVR